MKKLLGIVGTITIAGSGMTGIVGNAPTPEKNKINYLQTNNLENLNRKKRATKISGGLSRSTSMPNLGTSRTIIPNFSSTPTLTSKPSFSSKFNKAVTNINAGLKPIETTTNILANASTLTANIFNMYNTSILTNATVKAHEAQTRANNLASELNRLSVNEKKAKIELEIYNLEIKVKKLKNEVDELKELNKDATGRQKEFNQKNIEQSEEEIRLKEKEIELYKNVIKTPQNR